MLSLTVHVHHVVNIAVWDMIAIVMLFLWYSEQSIRWPVFIVKYILVMYLCWQDCVYCVFYFLSEWLKLTYSFINWDVWFCLFCVCCLFLYESVVFQSRWQMVNKKNSNKCIIIMLWEFIHQIKYRTPFLIKY